LDNNDTCEIDLQKALNVKYEVMYLFGEYTQADDISAVMGIEYFRKKSIVDSHKRIILLRDNKIVYEDDFSTLYLRFSEITEKVDTVNKNNPYLVHYGSRYKLIRDINDNSKYFLEPLSDSTQYERYDYTWDKGYKFKKRTK